MMRVDLKERVGNFSASKKSALFKCASRCASRVFTDAASMVTSTFDLVTSPSWRSSVPETPENWPFTFEIIMCLTLSSAMECAGSMAQVLTAVCGAVGVVDMYWLLVRRLNRRGVVNEKVTRKWCSDPHRPRVMRSCSQEQRRSVDRGTCGPGIQPRKRITPGCRRCRRKRKAPSGAPISRGVPESRAVRDPEHVRRHLARESGDPRTAQGSSSLGTHREV